jgi:hypothetical protein
MKRPRNFSSLFCSLLLVSLTSAASAAEGEMRCGWFDNPTPANASLFDKDGEWTIGVQGDHQAEGDWPTFQPSQWVSSGNGSYGRGCACMRVKVDVEQQNILTIYSAEAKPLSACRNDKSLQGVEDSLQ